MLLCFHYEPSIESHAEYRVMIEMVFYPKGTITGYKVLCVFFCFRQPGKPPQALIFLHRISHRTVREVINSESSPSLQNSDGHYSHYILSEWHLTEVYNAI